MSLHAVLCRRLLNVARLPRTSRLNAAGSGTATRLPAADPRNDWAEVVGCTVSQNM